MSGGGPTTRGPRYLRATLREYVRAGLPPLVPHLRDEWKDEGAFPPGGPGSDSPEVPGTREHVQSAMGRPADRWPLVQVELGSATVRRASIETTEGTDSVLYFTTYALSVFVWIDVDLPESVPTDEEREYVTDVRDDLQMALRYLLLDTPAVGGDPELVVLPSTYAEDYGEPQAAGGQRWTVGGRARFSVRAQERLSRTSLATVPEEGTGDFTFGIQTYPVPVDHPALR